MEMKNLLFFSLAILLSCSTQDVEQSNSDIYVVVLGIAQDAGSPQIGCQKKCCKDLWDNLANRQKVVSLGLVDKKNNKVWIFDATPDFKDQLRDLLLHLPNGKIANLQGIFLTHAHIGHYTGLMDLGRESMGADKVPVFAMPRMKSFLKENGPWSQLVSLGNIQISDLSVDSTIMLTEDLTLTPFLVPHRDEYSETVGFKVSNKSKSFLFIPDIDKWQKWDKDIRQEVKNVDYAFLDGAFYTQDEIPNRDMSEIPHPFVPETIELFNDDGPQTKGKVIFIHLNHTNTLLKDQAEYKKVLSEGFKVAREGQTFALD